LWQILKVDHQKFPTDRDHDRNLTEFQKCANVTAFSEFSATCVERTSPLLVVFDYQVLKLVVFFSENLVTTNGRTVPYGISAVATTFFKKLSHSNHLFKEFQP